MKRLTAHTLLTLVLLATAKTQTQTTKANSSTKANMKADAVQRPNGLYRYLLRQGKTGHRVAGVIMVWEEFLKRYVPDLVRLYVLVWGGRRRSGRGSFSSFQGVEHEDGASVHEKYVAFSRVKKSKRADKLADKANVKLLDEIGDDLDGVKYAYVSQRFQRRHRLGSVDIDCESDDLKDVLANDQSFERNESEDNSSPSFGITFGAKLTSSNRKLPKSKKLSNKSQERTKKSESRTTGFADNMMKGISSKSKFFGAYPADALPIEECGSADGLARFARKYGYGSWNEDDDRKVFRKRRSRKNILSISSDDIISNTSSKRSTSRRRQTALLSSPGRTRLPMESIEMLNEEFACLEDD